jgi:23S rRNA (cytosine1962-C5)-methyltransferase
MEKKIVKLKPGRDKAIKNYHHWIFSGAISSLPQFTDGDILPVYSAGNEMLGHAYFNSRTSISGRVLSFGEADPIESLKNNLKSAIKFRAAFFSENTSAYRLINSEGDKIPGLIVDKYGETLVLQISTLGIEKLKNIIVETLVAELKPKCVYEKSDLPSRREEGLKNQEGILYGEMPGDQIILENNLKFKVNLVKGQKTGFFLDQREMRSLVKKLGKKKRVLNCFGYTGGFSVYAAAGGATKVDTVDISVEAVELAKENFLLNNLVTKNSDFIAADAFDFLRESELNYDLIILDPPAFAKKKADIIPACRGYKDLNRIALQKIPSSSLLLTSSCSYHVDEKLFQQVIFQAAREANRRVRLIGRHILAPDHPINIFHPEGEYLKSLILQVE